MFQLGEKKDFVERTDKSGTKNKQKLQNLWETLLVPSRPYSFPHLFSFHWPSPPFPFPLPSSFLSLPTQMLPSSFPSPTYNYPYPLLFPTPSLFPTTSLPPSLYLSPFLYSSVSETRRGGFMVAMTRLRERERNPKRSKVNF